MSEIAKVPPSQPIASPEAIKQANYSRFNPIRTLTPERLSQALDSFKTGWLREAALLWEAMIERDDTLSSVEPKRRSSVKHKTWRIEPVSGADEAEAARHAACLEYFYNHATVVNAYDRNEAGEFEKLVEQMMSAVAMRYAAHHLVWKPQPGKTVKVESGGTVPVITAEFEFVPLYFFENTTGTLRYDGTGTGSPGRPLADREWMVTCDRGIMFAASVAFQFKRLSFQDWTIFNERYAQGKVVVRTPGSAESPEGKAAAAMAEQFTGDMAAVVYNDQGGDKSPIEVIEPKGTASVEAFAKFVERQDRKMAALFRGADLSSMSAGDGDGTGASLQGEEAELLERGDASLIGGTLRRVIDRAVIAICFGEGVEPCAYFRLDGEEEQEEEDVQQLRENAAFCADRGMNVDAEEVAARLNVPLAAEGALILGKKVEPLNPMIPPFGTPNASMEMQAILRNGLADVTGVVPETFLPVGDILGAIIRAAENGQLTVAELADLAEAAADRMPDLLTKELVQEVAAPLEGVYGAGVLHGARLGLRRKAQIENA